MRLRKVTPRRVSGVEQIHFRDVAVVIDLRHTTPLRALHSAAHGWKLRCLGKGVLSTLPPRIGFVSRDAAKAADEKTHVRASSTALDDICSQGKARWDVRVSGVVGTGVH